MANTKRYTVTAALPYANGPLHIGHIAGAYLPSDIYVRYLKMRGKDVLFVCGSDEHGAAITLRAKKEGITPHDIVDKYHELNKSAFQDFGIEYDIFHRTSSDLHHETAQKHFKTLHDKGVFEEQKSEQYYDEEADQFLADRYITGTCPKCQYDAAYGDQCEKCGSALSPLELINPKSTLSGNKPVLKATSHWYLPLNKHEEWLKDWITNGTLDGKPHHDPKEWKKQVLGQCLSWIDGGLKPRAMTRDLDWGVPVPVEGGEGKVLYVWLDAPIGYISATKQWAADKDKNWEDYWKSDDTKLVHFIGKDNIVFHCIIFPILLKAHGEYILPDNVPANEFLNLESNKISTSRNWAVWLHEYLHDFPDKQDELRYVLCSIAPESKDSEFTWNDYQARVNNELVAILGNFVNRALVLTQKYYDGSIPNHHEDCGWDYDTIIQNTYEKVGAHIEKYEFRNALSEMMNLARFGNKYLAETEPWKLVKTDPKKTESILFEALQIVAHLSEICSPFLPHTSKKLKRMLQLQADAPAWDKKNIDLIKTGSSIAKPELLFGKIEDEVIAEQITKLQASKLSNVSIQHHPMKPEITFDEFTKMDIRVGTIISAEKVEKADKLLKLQVDTGLDQRTIVSGIAEHYSPEDIIGQKVSILLNLAPRKIRGVESQGMILMAENEAGELSFVSPTKDCSEGGEIR